MEKGSIKGLDSCVIYSFILGMRDIYKKSDPVRQERFAVEYVRTMNATEAYQIAYPESERTSASTSANRLMKNERVKKLIRGYREMLAKQFQIDSQALVDEAKKIAFGDISDVVSWTGVSAQARNSEDLPRSVTGAIKAVKQTKDGIEIVMHDKMAGIAKLGAHLGLFSEKIDVKVKHEHTVDYGKIALESLAALKIKRAEEVPVEVTPE